MDTDLAPGRQAALTFTALNWNIWQTVAAMTTSDADAVDEASDVAHVASAAGHEDVSRILRVAVRDDEQTGTDYDGDEDGLIEIASLAQLNAVRWDLDGNGFGFSATTSAAYRAAFPGAAAGMGCPDGGDSDDAPDACAGYELTRDLDLRHRRRRFHVGGDERHGDERRRRRVPQRRQRLVADRHPRRALQHDV